MTTTRHEEFAIYRAQCYFDDIQDKVWCTDRKSAEGVASFRKHRKF